MIADVFAPLTEIGMVFWHYELDRKLEEKLVRQMARALEKQVEELCEPKAELNKELRPLFYDSGNKYSINTWGKGPGYAWEIAQGFGELIGAGADYVYEYVLPFMVFDKELFDSVMQDRLDSLNGYPNGGPVY